MSSGGTALTAAEIRERLSDPELAARVTALGFADDDRTDVLAAAAAVDGHVELDQIATLANRLIARIGAFEPVQESVWTPPYARSDQPDQGVLPILTLIVTAPEVAAFHAGRGIPLEVSAASLADLGQQVFVHRLTYGRFGLHTHGWLAIAWSGALYALGRLQFNLQRDSSGEWVLGTHIPRTGPLDPAAVDAAFAAATDFFRTHFPDYPAREFVCSSWLLDPELATRLPDSNLAAFQRRWVLYGDPLPGDDDLVFFVFNRRGPTDLDDLPTDTSLRRAYVERRRSGQSWSTRTGRIRMGP